MLANRYLETFILKLFYKQECEKGLKKEIKIKIDEKKKISKGELINNFNNFIKNYDLTSQ